MYRTSRSCNALLGIGVSCWPYFLRVSPSRAVDETWNRATKNVSSSWGLSLLAKCQSFTARSPPKRTIHQEREKQQNDTERNRAVEVASTDPISLDAGLEAGLSRRRAA
jgi:hypothetical protein